MSQVDVAEPVSVPETPASSMMLKEVLRFSFQGYAVWLELEQFPTSPASAAAAAAAAAAGHPEDYHSNNSIVGSDLDQAIRKASQDLNVVPIPAPHMTMLYGISHLSEQEVRKRFQDLAFQLQEEEWPLLEPKGFLSDVEIDGVNGGEMNMAWIETSYKTSEVLEGLIDQTFECFHGETGRVRNGPWCPHISLAYDNQEYPISTDYLRSLVERFPTLALPRKVQALSLWDLNGTIDQWSLVDRFPLDYKSPAFIRDD